MPYALSPLCQVCTHYNPSGEKTACAAFPEGIPDEILAGVRHIDFYPGDHGMMFRKKTKVPTFFILETKPETLFRITCAGSYERYVPIIDLWELDNSFIRYILATDIKFRDIEVSEADIFMDNKRECLEAMNPCMREVRQKMYLQSRKSESP